LTATLFYRIAALAPGVERSGFCCGVDALDRYFQERVTLDLRRRVTRCFVSLYASGRVAGFYTLAATSILSSDVPQSVARRLPRNPTIMAVRMRHLAVDRIAQGTGLGAALLADGLARCVRAPIAAFALVVDAKRPAAFAFYQHHGFIGLAVRPATLFLPLATVARLVR
jgi:ribosomal protein S18 acetylase RimI-like enzyme